mgnify:FL=1
MHDFSHFAVGPAVFIIAFLTFAVFMPLMAFAVFRFAGKGWSENGTMMFPWMHAASVFSEVGSRQREDVATGNTAFDTYRAETIARLDEEAKAFAAYRDRLRAATDRAAFEHFISEMTVAPRS